MFGESVLVSDDNLVVEVMNSESAGVFVDGSSNLVILDGDQASVTISGNGNTVIGSGTNNSGFAIFGESTENIISLGDWAHVQDSSINGGNTITVGDNGQIIASKNDTIYAGVGSNIGFCGGDVISADNSYIRANPFVDSYSGDISVNGDANRIEVGGGTLVLNGSNNSITASTYVVRPNIRVEEETIKTSTASIVAGVNGMVLTGAANATNITLTGGVATVNLGDGNVVTLSGISSGATVQYIDASGATTVSTLTDANVENTGGTLFNVSGDATVGQDNAFFDVLNGNTALNVAGSGNTVFLEANGDDVKVAGDGNTFMGSDSERFFVSGSDNLFSLGERAFVEVEGRGKTVFGADYSGASLSGSNNFVTVGDHASVSDFGDGNTITFGNDAYGLIYDAHVTINAETGGRFYLENGGTINSNGADIFEGGSGSVNGDSNRVNFTGDNLSLTGSNNSISMSTLAGGVSVGTRHDAQVINTATGSFTNLGTEIVITGSINVNSVKWAAGGVATIDLGSGNVVTLSGVVSGTSVKYIDNSGSATVATLTDPSLLHVSGTLYNVKSDIYTVQNKSILDVFNGASLYLSGTSNQVILESGSHGGYVSGDKNTIVGSKVSGATERIVGNGNVAQFGANNTVCNVGVGNTITVGANSEVYDAFSANVNNDGSSYFTTINATQGGALIRIYGNGETVNANSATIQEIWTSMARGSSSIKGNGNLIDVISYGWDMAGTMLLSLNGSNNTIHLNSAPDQTIKTTTGSLVAKSDELVLTGTADANSISLANGVATVNLGGGNVVTLNGVYSGANVEYIDASGNGTWSVLQDSASGLSSMRAAGGTQADPQVNQLVAAMASYSADNGGVGASAQTLRNANVQTLAASATLH
ncbi:hypothetical protein BG58_05475 [Caballeronia jiangsuensis]|nr:hypothetical protein BG58_05475 [Caballeronia jiangsuensis]